MFAGWDNFYLMIGGAAGALIGLFFVVATLSGRHGREASLRGAGIYMTPTVFGLAVVLAVSALTAMPGLSGRILGMILIGVAVLGAAQGASVCWQLMSRRTPAPPHWSDHWCYGVGPTAAYMAIGGAGWAFEIGASWAAHALAGVLLAALLLAIRNAWDLVTWLSASASERPAAGPAGP
jgi:hypothetical protein